MSRGINLLVEEKKKTVHPLITKIIALRISAVGLLFLVSILSVILFLLIALSPIPQLRRQEQVAKDNLATFHPDIAKLQIINERATAIAGIMTKRTAFDKTIDFLQSKLPRGVSIETLTMSKKAIEVTVSSKSLNSLNAFINNLDASVEQKDTFSSVTLSSLSSEDTKDYYSLTLNLTNI